VGTWLVGLQFGLIASIGALAAPAFIAGAWAADGGRAGWSWLLAAALAAVPWAKAVLEERWMALQHADHAAYQASTKRFIPGWF
jgi:hypothetical protein